MRACPHRGINAWRETQSASLALLGWLAVWDGGRETTPARWRSASTRRSSAGTGGPRAASSTRRAGWKLEQQEKKPCEEAILSLELPKGGTVADRACT